MMMRFSWRRRSLIPMSLILMSLILICPPPLLAHTRREYAAARDAKYKMWGASERLVPEAGSHGFVRLADGHVIIAALIHL
jgi:hypothetical protein